MRNPIDDAIAALRRGDQAKAFALLRGQLTRDPKDATAWLWMSEATPNIESKIDALERFIQLAPDHPRVPSAHTRMAYLKSQVIKTSPLPPPVTPLPDHAEQSDIPTSRAVISPEEPPRPIRRREPPGAAEGVSTTPPVRESLLSGVARPLPKPASLNENLRPEPDVSMNIQTAPHPIYKPAIPDLLQSLLDTAPMPRVRTDIPVEPHRPLEALSRPATPVPSSPPDPVAVASDDATESHVPTALAEDEALPASQSHITPRWAWVLILLMATQIILLVYIIVRIELIVATVR